MNHFQIYQEKLKQLLTENYKVDSFYVIRNGVENTQHISMSLSIVLPASGRLHVSFHHS